MKNFNKVCDALRKGLKLVKQFPESLDMKELSLYSRDEYPMGNGCFAYHLALAHNVPDEFLVLKRLEDLAPDRLEKKLVNAVLWVDNKFGKELFDLSCLSRWPTELKFKYYESSSGQERVEVLTQVVNLWIENKGKFGADTSRKSI